MTNSEQNKEKTINRLRVKAAEKSGPVTLSLFVTPKPNENIQSIAQRLITTKGVHGIVDIVQTHPLAGSFSVHGAPDALARLVESDEVDEALLSEQPDILPKPIRRKEVDLDRLGNEISPVKAPVRPPRNSSQPRPGARRRTPKRR